MRPYPGPAFLDRHALTVFRYAFGLTLIANWLNRMGGGRAVLHYTEAGALPLSLVPGGVRWSFLDWFSDPRFFAIGAASILAVYVFYTLGWGLKWMKWAVVLALLSFMHRNVYLDDGTDAILRWVALWQLVFPIEDTPAITDRAPDSEPSRAYAPAYGWASAVFIVNWGFCYVLNALQKDTPEWENGSMIFRTMQSDLWVVTPFGGWLRDTDWTWIFSALTYGAKWGELVMGFLIWSLLFTTRTRGAVFFSIVALHLGIALFIDVGSFSFAMMSLACLAIPVWRGSGSVPEKAATVRRPGVLFYVAFAFVGLFHTGNLLFYNSFLLRETPLGPAWMRATAPAMEFFRAIQHWAMFRSVGEFGRLSVVVERDGGLWDVLCDREFVPATEKLRPSCLSKYWVSFLSNSQRYPNAHLLEGLSLAFSRQGVEGIRIYHTRSAQPEAVRIY